MVGIKTRNINEIESFSAWLLGSWKLNGFNIFELTNVCNINLFILKIEDEIQIHYQISDVVIIALQYYLILNSDKS